MRKKCEWREDGRGEGIWDTSCGNSFVFNADGPTKNAFAFCPYCGAELREAMDPVEAAERHLESQGIPT